MSTYTLRSILAWLLAGVFTMCSVHVSADTIQAQLVAHWNDRAIIPASSGTTMGEVTIDTANNVVLVFGSPVKSLSVELVSPSGSHYVSGDSSSIIYPSPDDPTATGVNHAFKLVEPEPGLWRYTLTGNVYIDRPVFVNMHSDSPYRSTILGHGDVVIGKPVTLATVVRNGELAHAAYSASANIISADTGQNVAQLDFKDNGVGADARADDGVATAVFTPQVAGTYWVKANISGTSDSGDTFIRTAETTLDGIANRAGKNRVREQLFLKNRVSAAGQGRIFQRV